MTESDANVQYSEDRNYWWDEHNAVWQPVDAAGHAAVAGADAGNASAPPAGSGSGSGAGSGSAAPPAHPALILLSGGESSWQPDPVLVGQPITVKWREYNTGGPSAAYTTNVALKKGNDVENELDVPFEPLGENQDAWREAELKGPIGVDLDYAIEIFVDSKNAPFHNDTNWSHLEIEVN